VPEDRRYLKLELSFYDRQANRIPTMFHDLTIRGSVPIIRPAYEDDVLSLAAVERAAAQVFRDVGLVWVAEGETLLAADLAEMCRGQTLWVAADGMDAPIGFLAAYVLDGQFYIAEVSVIPSYQRQGVGGALIATAISHAESRNFQYVTLTSYRDLAWNGPFYSKLGFVEAEAAAMGLEHVRKILEEIRAGHDPEKRCVMVKCLPTWSA